MKTIIQISIIILTVQFASCEKENNVTPTPINTVLEYKNDKIFRLYAYNKNRLFQYHQYTYSGLIEDSVEFFYTGRRLDSTYTYSIPSGDKYFTLYKYDGEFLSSIVKEGNHNYFKEFTLHYSKFNEVFHISYYTDIQPAGGYYLLTAQGDLDVHINQYTSSLFEYNFEENNFTNNSKTNVLQPFWVLDPNEFSPSKKMIIEQRQNTKSTNDGSLNINAVWYYSTNRLSYEYTYYPDGNIMTKTILDSASNVLDVYEYEYMTN